MKKTLVGVVKSNKMDKSLRVEVERRFRHRIYGKIIRGRTVCHVHDEENAASEGDVVEIVECRPRSKSKRWDLVRIVESNAAPVDATTGTAQPESTSEETAGGADD